MWAFPHYDRELSEHTRLEKLNHQVKTHIVTLHDQLVYLMYYQYMFLNLCHYIITVQL